MLSETSTPRSLVPLILFFVGALGLPWLLYLASPYHAGYQLVLSLGSGMPLWRQVMLFFLAGFSPLLAAVGVSAWQSGAAGVRALLAQLLRWRCGFWWYLLALFGPGLLMLAALGLHVALGGTLPLSPLSVLWSALPYAPPSVPWLALPLVFVMTLLALCFSAVGEEVGWRAFALPGLQTCFGALWASLILGVIWAAWHVTFSQVPAHLPWWLFLLGTLALSILCTWLYNSTGRSLLLVALFHGAINTWAVLLPIAPTFAGDLRPAALFVGLLWVCAFVVVLIAGPTLSGIRRRTAPR